MSDCELCKPEPMRRIQAPGFPIQMVGTRHRIDCPLVPQMEPSEWLRERLAEIAECERRAWREAQGWVIG